MAKLQNNGIDYYPHYVDRGNKLTALCNTFSGNGYYVFFEILSEIYKNGFYLDLNQFNLKLFSAMRGLELLEVENIIKFCVDFELFNNDMFQKNILTSKKIQLQYFQVVTAARKKITINQECLLIDLKKELTKKQIEYSVTNYAEPTYEKSNLTNEEITEEELKKIIGEI